MKNKLSFIMLFALCLSANLFAQGLNNEQYEFDKSDSENIQKFFYGIDTYKFYVNARYNEDYDIIIEEYKNKKIIDTTNKINDIIKAFGMNPVNSKTGDDFIRIYVKNNIEDKKNVDLRISYLNMSMSEKFKNLDIKLMQTRAFSDIPNRIEEKTPVLAIYGNKGDEFISCPGGAKPKDIVELYDWVTIIYLDRIKPKKEE
jgi:hypothetical protein